MTQVRTEFTSRYAIDPIAAAAMGTAELRNNFHIGNLFERGRVNLTYTHYDRMIVGGAMPVMNHLRSKLLNQPEQRTYLIAAS